MSGLTLHDQGPDLDRFGGKQEVTKPSLGDVAQPIALSWQHSWPPTLRPRRHTPLIPFRSKPCWAAGSLLIQLTAPFRPRNNCACLERPSENRSIWPPRVSARLMAPGSDHGVGKRLYAAWAHDRPEWPRRARLCPTRRLRRGAGMRLATFSRLLTTGGTENPRPGATLRRGGVENATHPFRDALTA